MWTSRFAPCPHAHRPRLRSTIVIVGFHTKRRGAHTALWCLFLGAISFLAPNTNQIGTWLLERLRQAGRVRAFTGGFAIGTLLLLLVINTARDSVSAFIYFNF